MWPRKELNDLTTCVFVVKSAVPPLHFLGAKHQKSGIKMREFSFVFALFLMSLDFEERLILISSSGFDMISIYGRLGQTYILHMYSRYRYLEAQRVSPSCSSSHRKTIDKIQQHCRPAQWATLALRTLSLLAIAIAKQYLGQERTDRWYVSTNAWRGTMRFLHHNDGVNRLARSAGTRSRKRNRLHIATQSSRYHQSCFLSQKSSSAKTPIRWILR